MLKPVIDSHHFAQLFQKNLLLKQWMRQCDIESTLLQNAQVVSTLILIIFNHSLQASVLCIIFLMEYLYNCFGCMWTGEWHFKNSFSEPTIFIFDSHAQAMWVYRMAKALGQPCTELLAPTICHTLKHWYQYTYLGL